jgi:hypothetical protein
VRKVIEVALKKIAELEKRYRKIELLERKQTRMGLDNDEKKELKQLIKKYNEECDFVVEEIIAYLINLLISSEGKKSLKKINKLINWNGEKRITFKEFEGILEVASKLNEEEIMEVEISLVKLHADIFRGLEKLCSSEGMMDLLSQIGKVIVNSENGDILDTISYIDSVYKDFADLLGIELPEVKLMYY